MSIRYLVALLPVLATTVFATRADAAPPHAPLPACTASIGLHLATGCHMRGSWYEGEINGAPSKQPIVVAKRQPAAARAIVPLDAALEGARMTYSVKFHARKESGNGMFDNNILVKVWLADDRNQNAVALRDVQLEIDRSGIGSITIEAPGKKLGYQPHYVYVSFHAIGNAYADAGIDAGPAIRVKDVEFGIYPTQS